MILRNLGRLRTFLWVVVLLTLVFAIYAWVGPMAGGAVTSRTGEVYYPALADAFLSGQLHLKIPPDPRLHALEKGWIVVPDGIPRLPEAVYFKERYYLYFSALPAVLFFMPVRLLFGVFPTDHFAVMVFCLAAWVVGAALLLWAWRQWFAGLSRLWLVLGLLVLAFSTRAIFLLQAPMVHGVPISCAFFCTMVALAGVAWTLHQDRPLRQLSGLALVSLAWGGAVACRPNYIFSLPAVGLLWLHLVRVARREQSLGWGTFLRLTTSAILPAAAVGLMLLAYNYARYGQFTEFGVRYHIGAIDGHSVQIFGLGNLLPNWRLFFLTLPSVPHFSTYFPFFPGWVGYWGILYSTPLLGLILAAPWALLGRPWRQDDRWTTFTLIILAGLILNSLSILLLTLVVGVAERYVVDFLPLAVLFALLVSFALLEAARRSPPAWWHRVLAVVVAAVAGGSLINSGLAIAMRSHPAERLPTLARAANNLVAKIEQRHGVRYGPMTLRVRFHDFKVGSREALLVSGHGRDIVYVDYIAPDQIRLGLDHLGSVNLASDPVLIEAGREYTLRLDLGNLYPPPEHPFFADMPVHAAHALRHRLTIHFEGEPVLQLGCVYYPTQPSDIFLGADGPGAAPRFRGTIVSAVQEGLPRLETLGGPRLGNPTRLTVRFPAFKNHHTEPLLSSGAWGHGDLLYVTYVGPNHLRFGHDSHGGGAFESELVPYVPDTPVTLDVDHPPLRPDFDPARPAPLIVRFGDRLIIDDPRPFHPARPYEIFLGFNGANSSQAGQLFQGRILRAEPLNGPVVPPADLIQSGHGPLRLTLRFPAFSAARSEPLLVTGVSGAADAFYVQYLDEGHIRIGYDHWGVGGAFSPPIAIDYRAFHRVEMSLGSLHPEPTDPAWGDMAEPERFAARTRVTAKLNGQKVLEAHVTAYPAQPSQIRIGQNTIGLSTCEPRFTGNISAQERLGLSPAP